MAVVDRVRERKTMIDNLTRRFSGEGVFPLAKIISVIGALALVLTMISVVPNRAGADESTDSTDSATTQTQSTEANAAPSLEPSTEPEAEPTDPVAVNEINPQIVVDVEDIVVDEDDTAIIAGKWDASLVDDTQGTDFYVEFPGDVFGDLDIVEPTSGAELRTDSSDDVVRFEVDTARQSIGDFELSATLLQEGAEEATLRTSQTAAEDVAVSIQRNASASRISTLQATGKRRH